MLTPLRRPLSFPKIPSEQIRAVRLNQRIIGGDGLRFLQLLGLFVVNLFWSRRRLEVESLFLRHQFNIALRRAPQCRRLRGSERALLVWMPWLWPSLLGLSRVSLARSCDGIEPGFEPIGAGNLAASQGDPESALSCGNLRSPPTLHMTCARATLTSLIRS
jgi:hypothetical protein